MTSKAFAGLALGLTAAMLTVGLLMVSQAAAEKEEKAKLSIGDKMPDFTLKDTKGEEHTLSNIEDKVVVLVFSNQECPVSNFSTGADPRLEKTAKAFTDKDVVFLKIDATNGRSADAINGYIEEHKLEVPILIDKGNVYADKVGAKVTPEVFVVAKDKTLVYHGAFDNAKKEESEYKNFTVDALTAVLAGEPVKTSHEAAFGCGIKRAMKAAQG